ncbi:hypothetical protein ACI65C_002994 [Semiaphis heraclei]
MVSVNIIAQNGIISLGPAHSGDGPQGRGGTTTEREPRPPRIRVNPVREENERRQSVAGLMWSSTRFREAGRKNRVSDGPQQLRRPTEEEQPLTSYVYFFCSFRHPVLVATAAMIAAEH